MNIPLAVVDLYDVPGDVLDWSVLYREGIRQVWTPTMHHQAAAGAGLTPHLLPYPPSRRIPLPRPMPGGAFWLFRAPWPAHWQARAWVDLHRSFARRGVAGLYRHTGQARAGDLRLQSGGALRRLSDATLHVAAWIPAGIWLLDGQRVSPGRRLLTTTPLYEGMCGCPLARQRDPGKPQPARGKGWTLFLDRDGVINTRLPGDYVRRPEDFHFLPGVPEAMGLLRQMFDRMVVVTNQQGIGKGLMSTDDLARVHRHMQTELERHGVTLDGIHHCPGLEADHPMGRKPLPGMAFQAMARYPDIVLERAVMVGDSGSDIEFGRRLGMWTVKVGDPGFGENQCTPSLLELARLWRGLWV